MTHDTFQILMDELDAWSRAGQTAVLWWRDDDAGAPCAALDALLEMSDRHAVPCGLAVIPVRAEEPLAKRIDEAPHAWALQHGFAHTNHASGGVGAWELGLHRPVTAVLDDLRAGMSKLAGLFGDRFVPVVVPPWNRMAPEFLPRLPGLGFRGVSASYKRQRPVPPDGLRVADAHCDLLEWKKKQPAFFSGREKCVADLVEHLTDKRTGRVDFDEPTGVLTHHLEMDGDAWNFMDDLLSATTAHPAAKWMSPADIWPER